MNMSKKIAIGMATVAALVSTPMAEQIAIAGQVAPIASLVPIGGNTNLQWGEIALGAAPNVDGTDNVPVAKFFVTTNMPKWNVYITFANGGKLLNASGVGTVAATSVALEFDTPLAAEDDAAATIAASVGAPATPLVLDAAALSAMQSFSSAIGDIVAGSNPCGAGVACSMTNWLNGTDVNSVGVDVTMAWTPAVAALRPKLAGTYSEIIYITLATSY